MGFKYAKIYCVIIFLALLPKFSLLTDDFHGFRFDNSSKGIHEKDHQGTDVRLVVVHHGLAILPCDTELSEAAIIDFRWYKDGNPIIPEGDDHMEISGSGQLWVKDAVADDSGLYICRAYTTIGMKEVNVTLIVLVPEGLPFFSDFLPNTTYERTIGSSVKFRCPVKGNPSPQISWYKDGILLLNTTSTNVKFSRWSVVIKNLEPSRAGNYTCIAVNRIGSVNATFTLHVLSTETHQIPNYNGSQPDLAVFHPLNTTVKYGSAATFQCRVRSEATPNIQWLKRIEETDETEADKSREIIKVQGENFRILQSSQLTEKSDGSYLNKLVIPEAHESDSGKYICLGANSMGYSFRSAYLTVLPRPRSLPLGWSHSVAPRTGRPNSLLIAIPITLGILVGVLVAMVVICHRRRMDTSIDLRAASTSSKEPPQRQTYRTATTAFDTKLDTETKSAPEPKNERVPMKVTTFQVQSEVEIARGGTAVTKLCQEQTSSNYDSCFVLRDEV